MFEMIHKIGSMADADSLYMSSDQDQDLSAVDADVEEDEVSEQGYMSKDIKFLYLLITERVGHFKQTIHCTYPECLPIHFDTSTMYTCTCTSARLNRYDVLVF